jgi:hypothetical protein
MAQLFEKQWPMQPGNGWELDKLIVSNRLKHVKEVWRQTEGQEDTKDADAKVDPDKAKDGDPDNAKDDDSDDDGNILHKKPASKKPAFEKLFEKPASQEEPASQEKPALKKKPATKEKPAPKKKPATTQKKPASRNKQKPAKLMAAKKMRS